MSSTRLQLSALILFCCILYVPALGGPFLLDDAGNLVANPTLQQRDISLENLRLVAHSSNSGMGGRPLSMISFGLNSWLADGLSPYHIKATNLIIHCLCGLLVFFLVRESLRFATGDRDHESSALVDSIAVFVAAFWLLAPLHVSTVAYAVQRMAQLSTLAILVGLLFYFRLRMRWLREAPDFQALVGLSLCIVLFAITAFLFKENGALLIPLVGVFEVCFFQGRINGGRSSLLVASGVASVLAPFALLVILWVTKADLITTGYSVVSFTIEERFATQLLVVWEYVFQFFFPRIDQMKLVFDDVPLVDLGSMYVLLALIAWGSLFVALPKLHSASPLISAGILFFLVGHSIESSIIPLAQKFEHRNYLPSVGLAMMLAGLLSRLSRRKAFQLASFSTALVLVIFCAGSLWSRALRWSDDLVLASSWVQQNPDSYYGYMEYGLSHYRRLYDPQLPGSRALVHVREAEAAFRRAANLEDQNIGALVQLAQLEYVHGRAPEGLQRLNHIQQMWQDGAPASAENIENLTVLIEFSGRAECDSTCKSKVENVLSAVDDRYGSAAWVSILEARFYYLTGDRKAALTMLSEAERLAPTAGDYATMALAYSGLGVEAGALRSLIGLTRKDEDRVFIHVRQRVLEMADQ